MSSPASKLLGLAAGVTLLLAGCGFRPGSEVPLPFTMHSTYIASNQPYGQLENFLRAALARRGITIVDNQTKATAVLQILSSHNSRRVLAVNANGSPAEYAIAYAVRFQLLGPHGKVLLAPQRLYLRRAYAYSPTVELGVEQEEDQILTDMRKDATRLILLRLEAAAQRNPDKAP